MDQDLNAVRRPVESGAEQARTAVGETLHTVMETLEVTIASVKSSLDAGKEQVAATVASTRDALPDAATLRENAAHLGENASALLDAAKDKVAATVNSTREALPDPALLAANATTFAENVGTTVGSNAKQAVTVAQKNPMGLVIGGFVVGVLVGLVVPVTDTERERFGPIRNDVLRKGRLAGQDAAAQGIAKLRATLLGTA